VILTAAATLASCGGNSAPSSTTQPRPTATEAAERPEPAASQSLKPPPCSPELVDCRRASGRIAYVERVDPDGDGDAHFVLLSSDSITGPGLTVVDVRRDLRPRPLPGIGDQLAAAGTVRTGSYGQRQIEAVEVRLAR